MEGVMKCKGGEEEVIGLAHAKILVWRPLCRCILCRDSFKVMNLFGWSDECQQVLELVLNFVATLVPTSRQVLVQRVFDLTASYHCRITAQTPVLFALLTGSFMYVLYCN